MALTDILDQIKKVTEEKMKALDAQHTKKVSKLDDEFAAKMKNAELLMDEAVVVNSKKIMNKMTTHAKMEAKNQLLKEKRELMDVVFETALKELAHSENYKGLLVGLLKHTVLTGEGITVCPAKGREEETRAAIAESGKDYKLCEESLNIKGGFILKSEKIEINNSFESILNKQLRSDLELDVAQTLFA